MKWSDIIAIVVMIIGAAAGFTLLAQQFNKSYCEEYKDIIATTRVCVDDKNMKCFVTPDHLMEFTKADRAYRQECSEP